MVERARDRVVVQDSPTGFGRGVFASVPMSAGEVIERCPVLVISKAHRAHLDETSLYDYYFSWPDDRAAIALGYGSLYNHSFRPNARYDQDPAALEVVFTAVEDIEAGEEIFVNYNGEPHLQDELWFDASEPRDPAPPV